MSNLEDHIAEQDRITAAYEAAHASKSQKLKPYTAICMETGAIGAYDDPLMYLIHAPESVTHEEATKLARHERLNDLGMEHYAQIEERFHVCFLIEGDHHAAAGKDWRG